MKDIKEILKKPAFVIGLEIVGALVISALLFLGVILPKYQAWSKLSNENKEAQSRFEKVDRNIEALRKVDAFEMEELSQKLTGLLPEKENPLKFTTLAEKVAAASGMQITAAQIEVPKTSQPVVSGTPTSSKPSLSSGTGTAGGTSPTTPTQAAGQAKSELTVKISFEGSFPALLVLLGNFGKAERASSISTLSLSQGKEGEGFITATIGFKLPISPQVQAASMETASVLTTKEIVFLQSLLAKIQITAEPTKSPTGREDPFK
jgi:hypothetical protein